ncbi:hypothetical protein JTB14_030462 [Gonioctena quinquepunctata]|nr:hypothetical protein JTB14_030462 [Gonioctena quinquepunctata]
MKRTVYITDIWRNSYLKKPTVLRPEGNGWNLIDNHYVFNWFEGDTVPSSIYGILLQKPTDTAETKSSEVAGYISGNKQLFNSIRIYGGKISSEQSDDDEETSSDVSDDDEENYFKNLSRLHYNQ